MTDDLATHDAWREKIKHAPNCNKAEMLDGDCSCGAERPCPSCGRPLGRDEVYRAGYEPDNCRTIPIKYGRGNYCDHFQREYLLP